MKKFIGFILLICLLFLPVLADETGGKTELGIKGGVNSYWGDINDRQVNGTASVSLFWWISDPFSIGFNGGASFLQAESGNQYFKTMFLKVWIKTKNPVYPYATHHLKGARKNLALFVGGIEAVFICFGGHTL